MMQLVQQAWRLFSDGRNGAVFHGNLLLYECTGIVHGPSAMRLMGDQTKVHNGRSTCITGTGCPFKSTVKVQAEKKMKIVCERFEDEDLKQMYEAGEDVSWVGEKIQFIDGEKCFEFSLDDSIPGEAILTKIVTNGISAQVRIAAATGSGAIALPKGDSLLINAIKYLSESRKVDRVAVYDAQCGFYKRLLANEII